MNSKTAAALGKLLNGVDAELDITKAALPATGRHVVDRSALRKGADAFPRTLVNLVEELSTGHAGTKHVFARVEECFRIVSAAPSAAKAEQARVEMELLETVWQKERVALEQYLGLRAQVPGVSASEAQKQASNVLQRLDAHFKSRYGFTTYLSRFPYEDPAKFEEVVRKELAKTNTSKALADELSDVANVMPFLKTPPAGLKKSANRGAELLKEVRALKQEAKTPKTSALKPKSPGAGRPKAPSVEDQVRAIRELERYCPEGDVLYDDIMDLIDERMLGSPPAGAKGAVPDDKFIDDLTDKVQARMGERLAMQNPTFNRRVWKPAKRTAEALRDALNKADLPDVPSPHQWRVEVIAEPSFATRPDGQGGELFDSGIWLVRESPEGNFAMPVFALEVKSGELRSSIYQQVLNRERISGGLVDLNLPGTARRYRLALPPEAEMQSALATTRAVSDKRLLGLTKDRVAADQASLRAADELLLFRVPMRRSDLRAAAYATVRTRLRQAKNLGK